MRRKPLMDMSQDLMESPLKKGEANMQPHPLGGLLPTPTHLKGLRIKPTACHRSFRLRWWSGWHRGVLRGFAGWGVVLLVLSAKPPCPSSKCRSMGTPTRKRPRAGYTQGGLLPRWTKLLLTIRERWVVPSLTPIRLRGARTGPIACLRSFRLKWWSGWHRGILRGFAGGVWVLLALLGRPPCPLSRCQRMDIIILSVAQAATVDMQAVHPCSGKIPPPQTPVMLAGGRPILTR